MKGTAREANFLSGSFFAEKLSISRASHSGRSAGNTPLLRNSRWRSWLALLLFDGEERRKKGKSLAFSEAFLSAGAMTKGHVCITSRVPCICIACKLFPRCRAVSGLSPLVGSDITAGERLVQYSKVSATAWAMLVITHFVPPGGRGLRLQVLLHVATCAVPSSAARCILYCTEREVRYISYVT